MTSRKQADLNIVLLKYEMIHDRQGTIVFSVVGGAGQWGIQPLNGRSLKHPKI